MVYAKLNDKFVVIGYFFVYLQKKYYGKMDYN